MKTQVILVDWENVQPELLPSPPRARITCYTYP